MTTVGTLVAEAARDLGAAGIEGARGDALVLLSAVTGWSRATLITGGERIVDATAADAFRRYVARREQREPVSHILGEREFWSLPFRVTAATLAPRPDSETVIEAALAQISDRQMPLHILDLGTGTGCLLAALLHELPNAGGVGIERDPAAADVARYNMGRLQLEKRARIITADWMAALGDEERFNVIVSNPPYIATTDAPTLAPEIGRYEPATALFAGEDGLAAYRALLPLAPRHLTADGVVVLELGAGQRAAVEALARQAGLTTVHCRRDLAGVERALAIKKTGEKSCGSAK